MELVPGKIYRCPSHHLLVYPEEHVALSQRENGYFWDFTKPIVLLKKPTSRHMGSRWDSDKTEWRIRQWREQRSKEIEIQIKSLLRNDLFMFIGYGEIKPRYTMLQIVTESAGWVISNKWMKWEQIDN